MRIAHEILGPYAPEEMATTTRECPAHLEFSELGEAVAWVAEALTDLMRREPLEASHCHPNQRARSVGTTLSTGQKCRPFRWSMTKTSLFRGHRYSLIKGLEFDYVIVLDVDSDHFRTRLMRATFCMSGQRCASTVVRLSGTTARRFFRLLAGFLEA